MARIDLGLVKGKDGLNVNINGVSPDANGNIVLDAQDIGALKNMGFMAGYKSVLEAASVSGTAGYTFFAVDGSSLIGCADAAFSGETQYFVMVDDSVASARRTVLAYSFSSASMKVRRIYAGAWHDGWSETFASKMGTLNALGEPHGASYILVCRHNVHLDNRFALTIPDVEVSVDFATTAKTAVFTDPSVPALRNVSAGTTDITAGAALASGQSYHVYE